MKPSYSSSCIISRLEKLERQPEHIAVEPERQTHWGDHDAGSNGGHRGQAGLTQRRDVIGREKGLWRSSGVAFMYFIFVLVNVVIIDRFDFDFYLVILRRQISAAGFDSSNKEKYVFTKIGIESFQQHIFARRKKTDQQLLGSFPSLLFCFVSFFCMFSTENLFYCLGSNPGRLDHRVYHTRGHQCVRHGLISIFKDIFVLIRT